MLKKYFWKKKLNQFNKEEWEALCDRCGKCCLINLEDEYNGDIFYTNKEKLPNKVISQIKNEIKQIEKKTLKKFGDLKNHLLLLSLIHI